jgi:hypothetical protein
MVLLPANRPVIVIVIVITSIRNEQYSVALQCDDFTRVCSNFSTNSPIQHDYIFSDRKLDYKVNY